MPSPSNSALITAAEADQLCHAYLAHSGQLAPTQLHVLGWTTEPIGSAPAGFLSHQLRLIISCSINSDPTVLSLSFFAKTTGPASPAQAAYISAYGVFRKEIRLYRTLIPRLAEAGESAFAPHCFYARVSDASAASDLLVFEDLTAGGFSNPPGIPDGLLDRHHLLLAVEALARMHASAMVLERTQTGRLDLAFGGHLAENAYPTGRAAVPAREQWVAGSTAALAALVEEMPELAGRQLGKRVSEGVAQIFGLCQPSERFRNCFGHGDLWRNNVMFKYAELRTSGGTDELESKVEANVVVMPVDVRFVDFQLARYAPPALDLMTLCTMCTTSAFRRENLAAVLGAYYDHLAAVLKQHGLSVAVELPRAEFEASCEFYRLAGLIECCLFSHMTLLPKEAAERVVGGGFGEFMGSEARVRTCVRAFREDGLYRERMSDMLGALVEFVVGVGERKLT